MTQFHPLICCTRSLSLSFTISLLYLTTRRVAKIDHKSFAAELTVILHLRELVLFSIPPNNIGESSRLQDSKESGVRKWQFCRHIRLRFDTLWSRLRAESLLPVASRQLPAVNKVKQVELVSGVQLAKASYR